MSHETLQTAAAQRFVRRRRRRAEFRYATFWPL